MLTAMGYPQEEARGALRLSLGRTTTDAEIDRGAALLPATIARSARASACWVRGMPRAGGHAGG